VRRTGTPERGCIKGAPPPYPLKAGAQVALHSSIISNFMIYQDQYETKFIAAIRAHLKFRMVFCNFCYISFEVSIVAKHVNAKRITIMAMGVLLH